MKSGGYQEFFSNFDINSIEESKKQEPADKEYRSTSSLFSNVRLTEQSPNKKDKSNKNKNMYDKLRGY